MDPKVNDHVSLQWPYEQPQDSNLRSQREQTSWSQVLTTGPPPRWLEAVFHNVGCGLVVLMRNDNDV